jgi:hypothetical protein
MRAEPEPALLWPTTSVNLERKEAGLEIDPATAEVFCTYGELLDRYGIAPDLPEVYRCSGVSSFPRSLDSDIRVFFGDLPKATCDALYRRHSQKSKPLWATWSLPRRR